MHTAFLCVLRPYVHGGYQSLPSFIGIAVYVLSALALYSMAQKRNIAHAWLAWVPVANVWILGSLSDQYSYVVRGQVKSRRKILLTLNILSALISTALFFLSFGSIARMLMKMADGLHDPMIMQMMLSGLMKAGGILMLVLPLTIWRKVLSFMALYDIYRSCDPQSAVMYLVLSIFFPVLEPIFLFVIRDQELGMPPRRPGTQNRQSAGNVSTEPAEEAQKAENTWESTPEAEENSQPQE